MFHLDPQEIESQPRRVRRYIHAIDRDGGREHGLARLEFLLDRIHPLFLVHFLISQTSETWHPRPLPPCPGSRVHARFNSPLRVASRGISNSTGRYGTTFGMYG